MWVVDTGESHAAGADQILAALMVYAVQAGDVPPGCVCFPESSSVSVYGVTTTAPTVHRIGRKGGVVLYGHGRVPEEVPVAVETNAAECPCNNAEGEAQARELGKAGQWAELHALTVAFPSAPGALQPAELAADAAAAGTPLDAAAVTRTIKERQEQAQAAQITADGPRDAVGQVRRQVAAEIEQRWRSG
ncbi:hypothetical protein [Micromonospora sp. NPDC049359]|uniref:hypothetical protein n=1 Tax=Micromonospora sp. NPDC049359 TaxID=3364270 RepID=UPI0037AF0696